MQTTFTDMILRAMETPAPDTVIVARFDDGRSIEFTTGILDMLKTDPQVIDVMMKETGELIYIR